MKNELLRQARQRRGWTQSDLGEKVGVTEQTVRSWEQGSRNPGPASRDRLCEIFGMTAPQLGLERTATPTYDPQHVSPAPLPPQQRPVQGDQNRRSMLKRVDARWISGVLDHSLYQGTLINLHLREQPDAVVNPWAQTVQESNLPSRALDESTHILDVYGEAESGLLILGESGAGKTTLLLELARALLERAQQEPTHPIPVVFNLSSWTQKRQPLAAWLGEELESKYQIPGKIGTDWINVDQILPLLDGLDEVDAVYRTACIQAINEYHQAHGLVPLVVCCRVNEYMSQEKHLALYRAVAIQPLTTEQANAYFARIGEQTASLRIAFQNDPVLQELATTPLMLTILIQAYQGSPLEEIEAGVSAEVHRQQIFAMYTQRMLGRRSATSRYRPEQTIHWLSYLARQMKQQGQTIFYVERMQPTWLLKKWQRQLYYGLIAGPICGLLVGLSILDTLSLFPLATLTAALMAALIVGLLFGWLSEPEAEKKGTKTITCTWTQIRQNLATALESRVIITIITGLAVGIGATLYVYLVDYPNEPYGSRIAFALSSGLLNRMYLGFPLGLVIKLERRIEPLEALSWSWTRIRRNIVRWLPISIGTGSILGLIFALPWIISRQDRWLVNFLSNGLSATFYLFFNSLLLTGVTRGLSKRVLDAQHIVTPNQGTWHSLRYGTVIAIISGTIVAAFAGTGYFIVSFWLPRYMGINLPPTVTDYSIVNMISHILGFYPTPAPGQEFWILNTLFWGLINGTILGLTAGLYCGCAAYVQHFVLRFLLWCTRCVPFNYPHFLDYAAERILLRKVGGGYIFMHRLLLEYFASLEEK